MGKVFLLGSNHSPSRENAPENSNFGFISQGGKVLHTVKCGEILETGCLLVQNDSKLFWQLDNYRVSSQASGQLWLCPMGE